jgi:hypothetical protein
MNTRERFQAVMNFQPYDRLPLVEWATWWDKTIERWHQEGLPKRITDRYDLYRHFGLEMYMQDWIRTRKRSCPHPQSHGAGIAVTDAEYHQIRRHLYPKRAVDHRRWERWAKLQATGEVVLWFTLDGFFWFPRQILGIERHLYAFYDQPALMHQINADLTEWLLTVIEDLCSICTPDFVTIAEDMSYNRGPMLSKPFFDEFMKPYYERIVPALHQRGIFVIVDSDGDVSRPAHWFEEVGVDGILPLERQAGVDINALRQAHPTMRYIGHYNKMVMDQGEAEIRAEFERLLPTAVNGGFLISCDHQTPPGVSYQEYLLYLKLFEEYAIEAGRRSQAQLSPTSVAVDDAQH